VSSVRGDHRFTAGARAAVGAGAHVELFVDVSYLENRSNLPGYDVRRTLISAGALWR
jgi:hypothetical protein